MSTDPLAPPSYGKCDLRAITRKENEFIRPKPGRQKGSFELGIKLFEFFQKMAAGNVYQIFWRKKKYKDDCRRETRTMITQVRAETLPD